MPVSSTRRIRTPVLLTPTIASTALLIVGLLIPSPMSAQEPEPVPANLVHMDLEGHRFQLSDFVRIRGEFPPLPGQEGPVILVFGAHWCVPCHLVIQTLWEMRNRLAEHHVRVLYVHVDDVDRGEGRTRDEITELVRRMAREPIFGGVRVLRGGDTLLVRQWGGDSVEEALPLTVLVRGDGTIAGRFQGDADTGERVAAFLAHLPARPPGPPPPAPRPRPR